MKIAVCLLLVAYALAEPPVDSRYLPPQAGYAQRLTASPDYRAPEFGSRTGGGGFGRQPSPSYGTPSPQSNYLPPSRRQRPQNSYLPPSGPSSNQRPTTEYGPPARPSNNYGPPARPSTNYASRPSTEYGAPGQNQYERPAQEYGTPEIGRGRPDITTAEFGQNQNRQYLPPGRGRSTGVEYDDGNSGEPANYSFEYMVKDDESGNDFGHRESRQGDRAEGLYYVLLPDGRKQTVEYEADQDGYKPRISYEDTGARSDNRNDRNTRGRGYDQYSAGY